MERVYGPEIERGKWHRIVTNVEWASGNDEHQGFMKIWVDGEQVYDYTGPTVLDSSPPPRPMKLSIYNSQWNSQDSYVDQRTVYFDDVRFAGSDASYQDMVGEPE